jgi:hypothetical protein
MENVPGMAASRRLFVGRDRELEELRSGLEEAAAGHASLFLLVGPAGMGKTRLADEGGRAAAARGMIALWGRCWETGGAPAYWPWIQVLRELTRGPAGAALLEAVGPAAQRLAPLLPEIVPAGVTAPEDADPVQARFRLFEAAVALLRAAADRTPLYVVLDDLHAADPSSLALMHFLARNLRGLHAVVVGTYRDEEARTSTEVGRALADIAREGAYLPLPPLDRGGISALVASAAGPAFDEALVDAVERATEGNPLFLGELLRLLAARGDFAQLSGGAALPIPDTVREVLGRRIARLQPETRVVLGAASVIGRDFATALLAAATGRPAAELERALDEADRAALVLAVGRGSWRFSHLLVREALYRELDPVARGQTHLRVAAALEAGGTREGKRESKRESVIAEIAHHRLSALPEGETGVAAEAARAASDRAMAMLAFEDAALLLQRGRQALEEAGGADRRVVCELELTEGVAWMRAGDAGRGRAACSAAADEARRLAAGDLLARAALGYGAELMLAQTDPKLVALLEEALVVLPPGPGGWRAQVLARLAATLQPAPDVKVPLAMAREAIVMARGIGDPQILRTVLQAGGSALADYAPPAERAAVSEELLALAQSAGDRFQVMRAQSRLVFDYLEQGATPKAERAAEGYEAVAREFRQSRHIWPGRLMRSMLASAQGAYAEARKLFEEAAPMAEADSDMTVPFVLSSCRMGHALESDRVADLSAAEGGMLKVMATLAIPSVPAAYLHFSVAMIRARLGDTEMVRQRLALVALEDPFIVAAGLVNAMLAEPIASTGDRAMAAAVYERITPWAGLVISFGRSGMSCGGPVDLALGILASVSGHHQRAHAHFEAALELAARGNLRPHQAHVRYWFARLLLERSGPGDAERALSLISEARTLALGLGMEILPGRLAELEAAAPQPKAPVRPTRPASPLPAAPIFSFVREGDYWTVRSGDALCRLRDSRGVQMLAELCAQPGRELHVLALSGGDDGALAGDAGEALDAEAMADYRARVEELDEEIAEAESFGDQARASRAQEERAAIAHELAQGVGLGGRARRVGGAAERARTNVQRRIRGAIRKIGESIPALGAYLDRTVRTGTFCSYEPL